MPAANSTVEATTKIERVPALVLAQPGVMNAQIW